MSANDSRLTGNYRGFANACQQESEGLDCLGVSITMPAHLSKRQKAKDCCSGSKIAHSEVCYVLP